MTLIYFILVLGITIFIHELGHFIFAKKAGVYVYEFALGMGPRIFHFKRKNDETTYSIRLLPIGGFVSMAGEGEEFDRDIAEDRHMQSKTWWSRFKVIIAGVMFNFILAFILLFIIGLINGEPMNKPYIETLSSDYPIYESNLKKGDLITKIDSTRIGSVDRLLLELQLKSGKTIKMEVVDSNGNTKKVDVTPVKVKEGDTEVYRYGFTIDTTISKGIFPAIKYAFTKTYNLLEQMVIVIKSLVTGDLSLDNLAGPVGIYQIIGESAKSGFLMIVYLTALISINVGFVNLLPIPAFDGGRLLFLFIEKIKGSKVDPKIENAIHSVGFILLLIFAIFITYNDIIRIFK